MSCRNGPQCRRVRGFDSRTQCPHAIARRELERLFVPAGRVFDDAARCRLRAPAQFGRPGLDRIGERRHLEGSGPLRPKGRTRAMTASIEVRRQAAAKKAVKIVLCAPRGFCAGVVRAIDVVEQALDRFGPPGLCASRDRAQQIRRREPQGEGRRSSSRNSTEMPETRRARHLFRPWRAEVRARGGEGAAISSPSTRPARW